eukprot:TRINITY_DN54282_c0_g1_i1.p2 TRINITY_DN54282_c0_g1~~TRINITY_DN54282_c0_g1_i1.p2  ORF type:complete len:179 (-),score=34.21 TRINITY_DN54282_c0_g1_i1:1399-1911(-)
MTDTSSSSSSDNFECNICFDPAKEPVVTVCGHLFCWKCLFEWIEKKEECPVCKAGCDKTKIIPMYGRGNAKPKDQGADIPERPKGRRPPNNTDSWRDRFFGGFQGGGGGGFGGGSSFFFVGGFPFMPMFMWSSGGGGQQPAQPMTPEERRAMKSKLIIAALFAVNLYVFW